MIRIARLVPIVFQRSHVVFTIFRTIGERKLYSALLPRGSYCIRTPCFLLQHVQDNTTFLLSLIFLEACSQYPCHRHPGTFKEQGQILFAPGSVSLFQRSFSIAAST